MAAQATKYAYRMSDNCAIEAHGMAQITAFLAKQPETLHIHNLQDDPEFRVRDIDLAWMRREGTKVTSPTIEAKICLPYSTTNFFLETVSNKSKSTPGGIIYSFADYFVFLFYFRRELYLIPAGELKQFLLQNWDALPDRETQTSVGGGSYTTVGKMVPEARIMAIPGVIKHTLTYDLHPDALKRLAKARPKLALVPKAPKVEQPVGQPTTGKAVCACCQKELSEKVAAYSLEHHGRWLCMPCQKRPPGGGTTGQP